jgi:hypothetical protein
MKRLLKVNSVAESRIVVLRAHGHIVAGSRRSASSVSLLFAFVIGDHQSPRNM